MSTDFFTLINNIFELLKIYKQGGVKKTLSRKRTFYLQFFYIRTHGANQTKTSI